MRSLAVVCTIIVLFIAQITFAQKSNGDSSPQGAKIQEVNTEKLDGHPAMVLANPNKNSFIIYSSVGGKLGSIGLDVTDAPIIDNLIKTSSHIKNLAFDARGETIYGLANIPNVSELLGLNKGMENIANRGSYFSGNVSQQGPLARISRINLSNKRIDSQLFRGRFFSSSMDVDERNRIFIGDRSSSVVLSILADEIFEKQKSKGETNIIKEYFVATELDTSSNIFVGENSIAEISTISSSKFLLVSEFGKQAISVFDTEKRTKVNLGKSQASYRPVSGEPSVVADIPITFDHSKRGESLVTLRWLNDNSNDKKMSLWLEVFDFSNEKNTYEWVLSTRVDSGLNIQRPRYNNKSNDEIKVEIIAVDDNANIIALASQRSNRVILYKRFENTLERINIFALNHDVLDMALASDGSSLVLISTDPDRKTFIANHLDSWNKDKFFEAGDNFVRQAQRVLAGVYRSKAVNPINVIDGFFEEETCNAAQLFSKEFNVQLPEDLSIKSNQIEASKIISNWNGSQARNSSTSNSQSDLDISEPIPLDDINYLCPVENIEDSFMQEFDPDSGLAILTIICDSTSSRFPAQIETIEFDITAEEISKIIVRLASCSYIKQKYPSIKLSNCIHRGE